ncbi:MAG: regulator of sirC expression with transglutaminase-like and TPR domain [Verrucomicrobiales bacterium]|jgi:regulator of sirC expression with transglutaminase-like and TPR domain
MSPEELAELIESPDASAADCLLHLSSILSERADALDIGHAALEALATGVAEPSIPALVHHLFDEQKFTGDVDTYHAEQNSFLDRVLERRIGMPITLAAVVVEVGARIGLDLHLIGMPGHVVVGVAGDGSRFIDAFAGTELDLSGLQRRFEAMFGRGIAVPPQSLAPIDTTSIVNRVCNNLTRTWAVNANNKLNRLLDVRVALPSAPTERRLLIDIAEARGRFDLAARLREEIDPNDPNIETLWAKLN